MSEQEGKIPNVIDNLRRIFQAVNEYSKMAEQLTGLTGPQLWAIKILANPSPMRVSDLARNMYLRPATIVGILDRLEKKKLVTRTRSLEDRRTVDLQLTEAGKQMVAKAPEVAQVMLVKGLDSLSEEQFACVDQGMQQIVRMLDAEHFIPQPLH